MFEVEFGEKAVGCLINSGIWLSLGWKLDRFAELGSILNLFFFVFWEPCSGRKDPLVRKRKEKTDELWRQNRRKKKRFLVTLLKRSLKEGRKVFILLMTEAVFPFLLFSPSWCPPKRLTCNWRKGIKMNGELHVVSQTCALKGLSTYFFATHPPCNLPEPLPLHLPSDEYEFAKLLFPQTSSKSQKMYWKKSFF